MKMENSQTTTSFSANNSGVNWVMLIYFGSGICSLIDEVVWVRLMKLTLGNTVYATSIVVSVFMGGLALGALIMSRYADRVNNRLRLYVLLEVFATLSALSMPWVLRLADGVYRWFFIKYQPSPTGLLLMQVILSAGILLVPTMVMGSTFPLLGRYVTALQDRVGRLVGKLYALNMLGAVLGCFLAGFVLIRIFGVMGTLYIAAGINMSVALGGWVLSRFYSVVGEPSETVTLAQQFSINTDLPARKKQYVLMLAFFTSGLISIGYEIIWMRSVVLLMGAFTYVFSAVLTIYLLGNVAGAWIGSLLSKRLRQPAAGFAVSLTCLGILGIIYIPVLSKWVQLSDTVFSILSRLPKVQSILIMVIPMFHNTVLFILPAIAMGIGFPLALQAWSEYHNKVGQTTGTVYGANTVGAVMGGILTGFLLIPSIGVQLSITLLGLIGIWVGGIMIQMFVNSTAVKWRVRYLILTVVLTIAAVIIPTDLFERRLVCPEKARLLAVKEGVTTTVSVYTGTQGELVLATSGIQVAGDNRDTFRIPQKILGHLGIFLNRNTTQVLSVGFGSGETTACMSLHNIDKIECIEIAPELVEIALKFFRHINLGNELSEKVNMIYMDAKNYLHLTENKYDLIVNDCINPVQVADNASLYTKEYFQSALDRLRPGGIFGTYLPVSEMPISCTNSVLGTFVDVFPYVTIWFPTTAPSEYDFWYLAGTKEPQSFSPRYIDSQLGPNNIRDSASYLNFHNSQYVLSCYIGDRDDLKRYLKEFHINSDFTPFVEFSTHLNEVRSLKSRWFGQFLAKVRGDSVLKHMDWAGLSKDEQDRWLQEHEVFYKVSSYLLKSRVDREVLSVLKDSYDGLKLMPSHAALLQQEDIYLSYAAGSLNIGLNSDKAIADMDSLLEQRPDFGIAWLIRSWALQNKNEIKPALDAAEKAVKYSPNNAEAQNNLGIISLKLGDVNEAVCYFERAVKLKPTNTRLHYNLATAFVRKGQFDQAVSEVRQVLQIQPTDVKAHRFLVDLLIKMGKKDEAVKAYREALRIAPGNVGAQRP